MIQSFDGASLPSLGLGSVVKRHAAGVLMCFAWLTGNAAVQSTTAQDPVIESLGPRIGVAVALPTNEAARLLAVSQAIDMAHKSADARLLGQAQGLIGPDWNNPQASAEIKLLQATIQQHRHEFPEALTTLREVTARSEAQSPTALQAWLTIAVIERVQGRYEAALQACQHLVGPTVLLYRLGCVAETQSLQGQVAAAQKGFKAALAVARTASQQGWIRSLIAEHEVRQGNTEQAARNFASSLVREPDHYTAVAYSDLLLATNQVSAALQVLVGQPDSDATLVRQAIALKRLGAKDAKALSHQVQARFDEQARRDSGRRSHLREQALYQLMVVGNAPLALTLAEENLTVQREAIDWWIALNSARAAGRSGRVAHFLTAVNKQGLRDARLRP